MKFHYTYGNERTSNLLAGTIDAVDIADAQNSLSQAYPKFVFHTMSPCSQKECSEQSLSIPTKLTTRRPR